MRPSIIWGSWLMVFDSKTVPSCAVCDLDHGYTVEFEPAWVDGWSIFRNRRDQALAHTLVYLWSSTLVIADDSLNDRLPR